MANPIVGSGPPQAGAALYGRRAGVWRAVPSAPAVAVDTDEGIFSFKRDSAPPFVIEVWARRSGTWRRVWVRNLAPGTPVAPTLTASAWRAGTSDYLLTATWPALAGVDHYDVEWTVNGVVTTVTSPTPSATKAVAPGLAVSVRVRGVDVYAVAGPWSTPGSGTVNVGPVVATCGVTAPGQMGQALTVTWTAPLGDPGSTVRSVSSEPAASWALTPGSRAASAPYTAGATDVTVTVSEGISGALGTPPAATCVASPRPAAQATNLHSPNDLSVRVTGSSPTAGASLVAQTSTNGGSSWSASIAIPNGTEANLGTFAFGASVTVRVQASASGRQSDWVLVGPVAVQGLLAPANFRKTSAANDYDSVDVAWDAVAGAEQYEVALLDPNGNVITSTQVTGLSHSFAVSWDQRVQVVVRARRNSAAAIGPWSGAIRWNVGHPQQMCQRWETRTREWLVNLSYVAGAAAYRDQCSCIIVPDRVAMAYMRLNLHLNPAWPPAPPASFESGTRYFWRINGGLVDRQAYANPVDVTFAWARNTPGQVGFYCQGSGWGTSPSSPYTVLGTITASGTESYDVLVDYVCVNEANGYPW